EDDQSEGNSDQSVANDGGTHGGPEVLQDCLVEGEPGLISAVGDARNAEVDPRGHRGAGREDEPETPQAIDVWKQVHEGNEAHDTTDSGPPEAEQSLLIARADGRQRHDEARDHGGVDSRIVETDEKDVTDERRQRAFHGELYIFGVRGGV